MSFSIGNNRDKLVEQILIQLLHNYISQLLYRKLGYNNRQIDRPETLEVEAEEEVDTDEKSPYILQSEVEKAIKEMKNRKATGDDDDDDVPGDVLKLLGEGGLKIMTKLTPFMKLESGPRTSRKLQ